MGLRQAGKPPKIAGAGDFVPAAGKSLPAFPGQETAASAIDKPGYKRNGHAVIPVIHLV